MVGWAAVALFAGFWSIGITSRWWAPTTASASHSYGVRIGTSTYFYPVVVGWLMDYGLWLFFGLLAVAGLIMLRHRSEVHLE
jgi:hypothetical protein